MLINLYNATGYTPEEIEKILTTTLADKIGEIVDVRLKKIQGFALHKAPGGKCLMMPYNKTFSNELELVNYMNQFHIGADGYITYRSRFLRAVTDKYITIDTLTGGDIGAFNIELDAIDSIWFIGSSVIYTQ